MLVCAGGRLALRASAPRALVRASRDRLSAFQRVHGSSPHLQGFTNVRNYWWSKPAASEVIVNPTSQNAATAPEQTAVSISSQQLVTDQVSISNPVSQVLPVDASSSSDLAEVASTVVPSLQYGDFAALGLTSWWPSGIISWSFELLQVSTGMPWFYTIVAGTLFWRLALVPTALTSIRNSARLRPYAEQIKALDDQAQGNKDRTVQMELMLKKQKLMEKAGVRLSSMFLPPVVQITGSLGLFFAVRKMVQLPLVQLTQSGVWFLPDLTVTGDYVMPTLVLLAMNVQFSLMKQELDPTKPAMAHVMNVMRVASFASLPMMTWMPSGLWLSICTGVLVATAQSAMLRVPRIRQVLAIPPVAPMPPVTMKDTGKAILDWYQAKRTEAMMSQSADPRKPNWTTLPKASRRAR